MIWNLITYVWDLNIAWGFIPIWLAACAWENHHAQR